MAIWSTRTRHQTNVHLFNARREMHTILVTYRLPASPVSDVAETTQIAAVTTEGQEPHEVVHAHNSNK